MIINYYIVLCIIVYYSIILVYGVYPILRHISQPSAHHDCENARHPRQMNISIQHVLNRRPEMPEPPATQIREKSWLLKKKMYCIIGLRNIRYKDNKCNES